MSAGQSRSERARGRVIGPSSKAWPICETSNSPARGAGVQMFGQNAGGILHRHVIAGEGNHARAELDMQRMQRRSQQIGARRTNRMRTWSHRSREQALASTPSPANAGRRLDGAPSVP